MMSRQTYNFVAKRIREDFPTYNPRSVYANDEVTLIKRGTLVDFALRCAYGFLQDNPNFKPIEFLTRCSPDPERYPIQELWEEFQDNMDAQNGS